jgi:peroxiredoxin Q/BCP
MSVLKVGDPAPDFVALNQYGKEVRQTDFRGKKVVLYFYPKDNTPSCTAQACNLRDNYEGLRKKGYEVIGISADSRRSHRNFIHKYGLPFTLISDVDKKVIESYGAWGEKQLFGRTFEGIIRMSFVISEEGKIEKIIRNVKTGDHARQIFEDHLH